MFEVVIAIFRNVYTIQMGINNVVFYVKCNINFVITFVKMKIKVFICQQIFLVFSILKLKSCVHIIGNSFYNMVWARILFSFHYLLYVGNIKNCMLNGIGYDTVKVIHCYIVWKAHFGSQNCLLFTFFHSIFSSSVCTVTTIIINIMNNTIKWRVTAQW